jgi:GAF domain-containing protein
MAIALENKTNIASVTKQLKRISVLHDIDLAISNSMDLTTTLNILLEHVKSQMEVDAVTILLQDESTEKYHLAADRGFTILADQHDWIREGTDIFSRTVTERKLFHTISIANQKTSSSFHRLWNQEGINTYVAVPLIAKGKVVGILETFHHLILRVDAEWLDFLETLAGQAAIAIDNHRMYSELQESHSNWS